MRELFNLPTRIWKRAYHKKNFGEDEEGVRLKVLKLLNVRISAKFKFFSSITCCSQNSAIILTYENLINTMAKRNINRIRVVLAEQDKSNKWLSEQMGVYEGTVSKWTTNNQQPSINNFLKIAELLDVDIRDLFESTKKKPS